MQSRDGSFQSKKISVTLPVSLNFSEESLRVPYAEAAKDKEVFVLQEAAEEPLEAEPEQKPAPAVPPKQYVLQKPAVTEVFSAPAAVPPKEETAPAVARPSYFNTAFDTVADPPTLPFMERRELHHVIAEKKESLNDKLKEQRTEVAHLLKEAPIKDLRKAIGINDRFAFVRELFRGDEAAYERSVKTINNFNILSEAEYWMARELKHKLGWDDKSETVQHFYSLVKRRFS